MTFKLIELLKTDNITKDTDADIVIQTIKTMYLKHKPKKTTIIISFRQIKFVSSVFLSKLFYWLYEEKYLKYDEKKEIFNFTKTITLDTERIEYFCIRQINIIKEEIDHYDEIINPRTKEKKPEQPYNNQPLTAWNATI
ncbi:MAG: hypothetical protein WC725_05205 [Patescibacteria group bacterium]|jgi:hypothetical protein